MFGKKLKHPLPKFPPAVAPTFQSLCQNIVEAEVVDLAHAIDRRIKEIRVQAKAHKMVDLEMAEAIAKSCRALVSVFGKRSEPERALIVGAVCYFAIAEDALPDESFASGLSDDAKVVNYVLEQLGIEGHYIQVE